MNAAQGLNILQLRAHFCIPLTTFGKYVKQRICSLLMCDWALKWILFPPGMRIFNYPSKTSLGIFLLAQFMRSMDFNLREIIHGHARRVKYSGPNTLNSCRKQF